MEKVWKLLSNFDNIEAGFWSEFKDIKTTLTNIETRQKENAERLDRLEETIQKQNGPKMDKLVECITENSGLNYALGKACREGFLQIKEAMEKLREELGEASGVLIDHSYHDGSCPR